MLRCSGGLCLIKITISSVPKSEPAKAQPPANKCPFVASRRSGQIESSDCRFSQVTPHHAAIWTHHLARRATLLSLVLFRFGYGSRLHRTVWRSVLQNDWHLALPTRRFRRPGPSRNWRAFVVTDSARHPWATMRPAGGCCRLSTVNAKTGAADCGEYRQAAGAVAQSLKLSRRRGSVSVSSVKETEDEKQAQHFGQ